MIQRQPISTLFPYTTLFRSSKSSQPLTPCSRSRQNALVARTCVRPARSFASCCARIPSSLIAAGSVADLKRRIQDLEAFLELGLGDAERRVGHDRVPAHEREHPAVEQGLGHGLHLA